MSRNLRNIAIIAHVDHGKTTLVDELLKQSGTLDAREDIGTCVMDSNVLEKERGITITAKNTAIRYGDNTLINIIDTPGHADFGGEVERILNMVDGVVLLVDAREGPMPQTKFVTSKALALGLKPIVVINKIDREGSDPDAVVDLTFDLFASLGATDEQLEFPVVYASAKNGYAKMSLDQESDNMTCLFETIIKHVEAPTGDTEKPLQMLATTLDWDEYIGRIVIGRIANGRIKTGQDITVVHADSSKENFRVTKLLGFLGMHRMEITEAEAGDIIAVAGIEHINIGETIACKDTPIALPVIHVDEPTLSMELHVNNSPLAGTEGKLITTRQIRDRLMREIRTNVAMRVEETDSADIYKVSGRGELHIGILLETMRREGFEMAVSRPTVIVRTIDGVKQEPYEHVTVDVESEFQGSVIEKLGKRGAEMTSMETNADGSTRIEFMSPTRSLIGYTSEFLTDTRGTGILHHVFHAYGPYVGPLPGRTNGVLVSMENGDSVAYALWKLQERGKMFIGAGEKLYEGMIIGINSRDSDMTVNPVKEKKLSNVRASGKDESIDLVPPMKLTLERAIEFIADDELVEITPKSIRLRKRYLKESDRKRTTRPA
ncbi:translational GTPase TypA [Mariprofundus erugo]|uniref:Large ribosomal subunit assembly factor BipA n=1 Tax=Mariprofundus erugo TaxID=2528639 RepID=A0A5R9GQR1_9PROT|nr:translational GTPase TypA [Mariprofundus erugo]TLS66302.1 translational GTPase TypA [Mariprofundus erugo]TLS78209.1 translational GTPase TypA [Mariprofundus erugo]